MAREIINKFKGGEGDKLQKYRKSEVVETFDTAF